MIRVPLVAAFILACALVSTPPSSAHALCKTDLFGNKYHCQTHRHYRKSRRKSKASRVYAYTYKQKEREYDWSCKRQVRAVGSQWISAKGAKASAIKAWREVVRFDYGERFSDWANAKDVTQGCAQSSIGDVIGKVFYRCVITATPCQMKLTSDGR